MCGFAGFVGWDADPGARPERAAVLRAMGRQLSRRGPDDEQLFDDDSLSLVFRRLSIVDLETGTQPIWNEDRTAFVVVNGEIYNHLELRGRLRQAHQFRSKSDSEIVLHLYEERGPEALELLNGIYAIAIWDTVARRLFLARDRLGVKPLFYAKAGSTLLFGSELKALLVHPDCPRQVAWEDLPRANPISFTAEPTLRTYVRGVKTLPGGHYAVAGSDGEIREKAYWRLEDHYPPKDAEPRQPAHYVEAFADLFEDAVRCQLMSDVPVGIFLSGGLDSAVITAVAARLGAKLHCFNLVEEIGLRTGDVQAARKIAEATAMPIHQVVFDWRTFHSKEKVTLETFEYLVWLMDSPILSAEFMMKHELHRYAKTAIPNLKVILLGQGADEFAGGYSNPAQFENDSWQSANRGWERSRHFASARMTAPPWLWPVMSPSFPVEAPWAPGPSLYHDQMRQHVSGLQNYNLWHEDRTSSAQGVEARVPFLDHRLVEFLAAIPPALHEELFWDKQIVRRAARRWLSPELTARQKVAFVATPDGGSSIGAFMAIVTDMLPAFCEKYLDAADAPLSKDGMMKLLGDAMSGTRPMFDVLPVVGACISISIFERMCSTIHRDFAVRHLNPPSSLQELQQLPEGSS